MADAQQRRRQARCLLQSAELQACTHRHQAQRQRRRADALQRHGGHLEIASQEGKGSTFTLSLPLESKA
mgnify:CR=1 FL=1